MMFCGWNGNGRPASLVVSNYIQMLLMVKVRG